MSTAFERCVSIPIGYPAAWRQKVQAILSSKCKVGSRHTQRPPDVMFPIATKSQADRHCNMHSINNVQMAKLLAAETFTA